MWWYVHFDERLSTQIPLNGLLAGCTLAIDTSECSIKTAQDELYSGYKHDHTLKYEGTTLFTNLLNFLSCC